MLAICVDRAHQGVSRQLARANPRRYPGEREIVRGRHPAIDVDGEQLGVRVSGQPRLDELPGPVGRAVVDDDQFVDQAGQPVEDLDDGGFLVVRGNHGDQARSRRSLTLPTRLGGHIHEFDSTSLGWQHPVTARVSGPALA